MPHPFLFLLLFVLCSGPALPAAHAQQAAPATRPMYGAAELVPGFSGWFLILADGTTPNPKNKVLEENGKDRRFEDEAAVLNFLYAQGWEVLPNGVLGSNRRYLLKRRPL
jgi:hypothetical protein